MKLHKWSDTLAKSKLSPERRARIQAEVEQELLEMNLQELRKAAGVTQADVAAKTGMAQADVSRTESREDHRLSTLRRYVEALGGELEVSAVVNGHRVRLVGV
jgi:DNA-binding phage protein